MKKVVVVVGEGGNRLEWLGNEEDWRGARTATRHVDTRRVLDSQVTAGSHGRIVYFEGGGYQSRVVQEREFREEPHPKIFGWQIGRAWWWEKICWDGWVNVWRAAHQTSGRTSSFLS